MMTPHEQVLQSMKAMAEKSQAMGLPLEMPPQSSQMLRVVYREVDIGKRLVVEIQFDFRFTNPTRVFQGGFLCAGFDEAYGPLSYMAAQRPVVTVDLNTTFIRPFTADHQAVVIAAEVISRTRSLVLMRAEAHSLTGKLIATSTNTSMVLNDGQLRAT